MSEAGEHLSPTSRQRDLLRVAARLFSERGYHAVGINDISGALGLTGPAFYRHYVSKEALLLVLLEDAVSARLAALGDLVRTCPDPGDRLARMVVQHLRLVIERGDELRAWQSEFRYLPEPERRRLRQLERLGTEHWVGTLLQARPELDPDQARARCQAVLALLQSPLNLAAGLRDEAAVRMLELMAIRALQV
jgi:AcrR family transcriptional regulator